MKNMDKEKKDICLIVIEIMKRIFDIPEELLGQEKWEMCLTSKEMGLDGIDLVYLLFEIERQYGVRFPSTLFDNHGFDTIMKIAGAVQRTTCKR